MVVDWNEHNKKTLELILEKDGIAAIKKAKENILANEQCLNKLFKRNRNACMPLHLYAPRNPNYEIYMETTEHKDYILNEIREILGETQTKQIPKRPLHYIPNRR